ncbi:MAG: VWA domain-containing protein [Myxococcales bacterium]|nr:VWA domain-containing protein [Myxococcales bacterium]
MAEPEELLLDGAHHATQFVRRLWRRGAEGADPAVLQLVDVRARLELFVRAAFGLSMTIRAAEPPAVPSWFTRLGRRIPAHLVERACAPGTDGVVLRLPPELPVDARGGGGLATYRLYAAEQAARALRETPRFLPADPLERALYLVREGAAVERLLVDELPGLGDAVREARRAALAKRPARERLSAQEAAVEAELLAVLGDDPTRGPRTGPEESLAWAAEQATRIRGVRGPFRGVPRVIPWGEVTAPSGGGERLVRGAADEPEGDAPKPRVAKMIRRPRVRSAADDEDDQNMGMWMVQLDDPQEHVEDPMGLQRPADRDGDADPEGLADSLSELEEARLVKTPERPREVLTSDEPVPVGAAQVRREATTPGLVYPEWDYRRRAYRERGAVVRERVPALGDPRWAEQVLARRAALLHEVRRRFERLRPRRVRLGRQRDGVEVDLAAYVAAHADRRAGLPADDRLYEAVRCTRRDVAIALLVDVSASTDSWITGDLRVVDVEKEALLVVCDALDALGDPYTILAFSGEGPEAVSVRRLKSFEEQIGPLVRRRIAGLEPERYTRMGAALRHATALLVRKPARHRLLLVLSDGKPNDVDQYEGRYGVEDTRQAVCEARLQGLHPFCVTVDRLAPAYMPRIFGSGGYAALHHPEHLPSVLVDVLRRLVKA